MIVFTITNKVTGTTYVGTTRNDLIFQWEKIIAAAELQLDFPLYREIRVQGADNFTVEEWDYTDDRSELATLEREALRSLKAESLRGYKTSIICEKSTDTTKPRKKIATRRSATKNTSTSTPQVETDDGQPIKHVNAGGESVVRFDRKTTTVADAISGIGNRTPEHTYLHPLRRAAAQPTLAEITPEISDTQKNSGKNNQTCPETISTHASNVEAITTNQRSAKQPSADTDSIESDVILSAAMAMLKQLQQPCDEPSDNSPDNLVLEQAPDETISAELKARRQRIFQAVERQRQLLINRCSEQHKLQKQKLEERINALELLAQEKMGRLSNAA